MAEASFLDSRNLPFAVEPGAAEQSFPGLIDLTSARREFFRENLLRHGALLFRGFAVETIEDFERFVRHFSGEDFFNYAGGVSPRLSLSKSVYTSTEYPPDLTLALHNEMSYSPSYPRRVYFFCVTPAAAGGATTLGDSRRILQRIAPETVALFKNRKVRYDRFLRGDAASDYSWQAAFETGERQAVEAVCRNAGASFEWQSNGDLRVSQIRPATIVHPETGEEVWFNQADGFHASGLDAETQDYFLSRREPFRLNSFYGNGEPIPLAALEGIRAVLREETVPHRWQEGDVLILDNLLTAHGRATFSGRRKIALAMT